VFERLAVDVLKSVVSVFESFARQQFRERVANAEELTSDSGDVFERLDHTAALFSEHAGVDLSRPETVRAVVDQLDDLVTRLEQEISAL